MLYYCTDEDSQNEPMKFEAPSAEAAAVAFLDYFDLTEESTRWHSVEVSTESGADGEWHTITLDPEEPACSRMLSDGSRWRSRIPHARRHDWRGIGAQGNASGGVASTQQCAECGTRLYTETLVDDGHGGQGTSIRYATQAEREREERV